jgi:hypothetical protein
MSDEIVISKVSLTHGGKKEKLVVSYKKKEPKGEAWFTVDNEEHTEPIHEDFRQSLDNLAIHYGILCGIVTEKQVKNIETPKPELIEDISINGFTRNGKENEKITITGTRKVPYGSTTMNSPVQNLLNDSDNSYSFMSDLDEKVDRCCEEAVKYITGEKRSAATLFNGESNGQEVEETEEAEA